MKLIQIMSVIRNTDNRVKYFFSFSIEKILHCGVRRRVNKVPRKGKIRTRENPQNEYYSHEMEDGREEFPSVRWRNSCFSIGGFVAFIPRPRKYKLRVATRRDATRRRRLLFPRRESTGYFPSRRRGADGPLSALFTRSPTSIGDDFVDSGLTFAWRESQFGFLFEFLNYPSLQGQTDFIF